ncbi:Uncharacterised protein [Budvicia aquatica]|uniref:Uncharacterized protein n=1 Tax=Budvicia aquatica TaxID=82979 RepID=A0A484ZN71_9GAMM|nr:Uncharacterised protein [Budvicia aquatica]
MSFIDKLLQDIPLPNMIKVRQHFASPNEIIDISQWLNKN